jgi:hypothetical protein
MTGAEGRTYFKASAALRLHGVDVDPAAITRALRLPPDHAHRKGDPRISRSGKGTVIEYAPYDAGMWSMSSEQWVESPRLDTHIAWVLDEIEPRADALARVLATGAVADIFCYSLGRTSTPPAIPKQILARAASLGLAVDVDHYAAVADDDPGRVEGV